MSWVDNENDVLWKCSLYIQVGEVLGYKPIPIIYRISLSQTSYRRCFIHKKKSFQNWTEMNYFNQDECLTQIFSTNFIIWYCLLLQKQVFKTFKILNFQLNHHYPLIFFMFHYIFQFFNLHSYLSLRYIPPS